ncbi:MAG: cell division protein ZapB [Planctomycetota bacterium]
MSAENQQLQSQVELLTTELQTLRQELAALKKNNVELANETQVLEQQATELQAMAGVATDDRVFAAQAERVRSAYDPEKDRTVVTFGAEPLEVDGNPGDFYFSVLYAHPGQATASVQTATLYLQTYRAGRLFHKRDVVEFQINGEPTALPITGFDLKPRRTGLPGKTRIDRSDETVEIQVSREVLATLGEARSLSVRVGRTVLTFDQDDIAALRAVARRMDGEE